MGTTVPQERIIWEGYSSWLDHAVLLFFIVIAAFRMLLAARAGEWVTVTLYGFAIAFFSGIAALFHYMQYYIVSSERIRVTSGLRKPQTVEVLLDHIQSISVRHEIFNSWFNLGALEITSKTAGQSDTKAMILKGIPDPERLKRRVDILAGLHRSESPEG